MQFNHIFSSGYSHNMSKFASENKDNSASDQVSWSFLSVTSKLFNPNIFMPPWNDFPAGIFMLEVSSRIMCEICLKLTIKIPE